MAIQRGSGSKPAVFSVGLNVILEGSKKMSPAEQEAALTVPEVRVLITSADGELVLVDEVLTAKEFNTGSVGYGLQVKGLSLRPRET